MAGVRATRSLGYNDPEQDMIDRKLMEAEALRKGGMSGDMGQGYQGGKVFIVGNPLGNIAKSIGGAYLGNKTEAENRDLTARRDEQMAEFLRNKPSATQSVEPMGPPVPGEGPMAPIQQNKPYDQLARENANWATSAMNIRHPLAQSIAQFGVQDELARPERMAEREDNQEQRRFTLQQTLEARAEQARLANEARAEQAQLAREAKAESDRQRSSDRMENTRLMASLRPAREPRTQIIDTVDDQGRPIKKVVELKAGDTYDAVPKAAARGGARAAKELEAMNELRDKLKLATDGLPHYSGFGTVIPQAVSQLYTSPETKMANAAMQSVSAEKAHELYGAAFTAPERARARQFLPDSGDTVESATVKLKAMNILLEKKFAQMEGRPDPFPDAYKNILDGPAKPIGQVGAPADGGQKTVVREVQLKDGRIGVEYSDGTRGFK